MSKKLVASNISQMISNQIPLQSFRVPIISIAVVTMAVAITFGGFGIKKSYFWNNHAAEFQNKINITKTNVSIIEMAIMNYLGQYPSFEAKDPMSELLSKGFLTEAIRDGFGNPIRIEVKYSQENSMPIYVSMVSVISSIVESNNKLFKLGAILKVSEGKWKDIE